MRPPGEYLALIAAACAVLLPAAAADLVRCEIPSQHAPGWGSAPLRLMSFYAETSRCVSLHVWLRPEDVNRTAKIIITSAISRTIAIEKYDSQKIKWRIKNPPAFKGICPAHTRNNLTMWELEYKCVRAEAGHPVSASFIGSTSYSTSYTVPDPVPQFHLSVDPALRTINVTLEPGALVLAALCYRVNKALCRHESAATRLTINPAESLWATFNVSYLLPCVCVQVSYTHSDAKRTTQCPFTNMSLEGVPDVWLSSKFILYEHRIAWRSQCPASYLKPSAALCWRNETGVCTPILNSSLEMIQSSPLLYNISTLDKHAQMCLQFSLKNNHHVHCPFKSGEINYYLLSYPSMTVLVLPSSVYNVHVCRLCLFVDESKWEARVGPGWRSLMVHLTSTVPASFSAQLCVLRHSGCYSIGHTYSGRTDGDTAGLQLNVPVHTEAEKPCVQVWQSEPAQLGKRILCPECECPSRYTHWRSGMFAVAALVIGVTLVSLAFLVYKVTKSGTTGWLSTHKPVLLVCSSGQPAHVSAVCALASILQGELCAAVRMALWSQSSERKSGAGAGAGGPAPGNGVADMGPLPWLYGEWDAVQRAQGKVLVVWSHEAKQVYETMRGQKTERRKREGTRQGEAKRGRAMDDLEEEEEEDWKLKERMLTYGTEKAILLAEDETAEATSFDGSSITWPVLRATLARLQGALQEPGRSHPVVLISLSGLSHNRDIPNELRGVPRYCLPGDFRGLIQELGGIAMGNNWEGLGCDCWPTLLSKILLLWSARRLSHQLKTWLP
ncbi:Interleukin-17 receptor E [Merluccius polli]|uniref:Interleukin-17 receptor E n=1 Tax=Merluccius polli TaxID=89951 RepID=A0AA47M470_MERPO|nr:Interleukin-17 receptor E [Merluccius polli]